MKKANFSVNICSDSVLSKMLNLKLKTAKPLIPALSLLVVVGCAQNKNPTLGYEVLQNDVAGYQRVVTAQKLAVCPQIHLSDSAVVVDEAQSSDDDSERTRALVDITLGGLADLNLIDLVVTSDEELGQTMIADNSVSVTKVEQTADANHPNSTDPGNPNLGKQGRDTSKDGIQFYKLQVNAPQQAVEAGANIRRVKFSIKRAVKAGGPQASTECKSDLNVFIQKTNSLSISSVKPVSGGAEIIAEGDVPVIQLEAGSKNNLNIQIELLATKATLISQSSKNIEESLFVDIIFDEDIQSKENPIIDLSKFEIVNPSVKPKLVATSKGRSLYVTQKTFDVVKIINEIKSKPSQYKYKKNQEGDIEGAFAVRARREDNPDFAPLKLLNIKFKHAGDL
ncbi:MAG: hypothetical protein COT74_14255 [Bdellovibrionales bacterium CG10_big_fil_rev_8_21_14_0_10_45_34]|nr:MAG: hypothetical protein COT74_14255 [Bdellovibrionales bacterium CG10_big_fil_rev_8_21_14_0_10_45_34]